MSILIKGMEMPKSCWSCLFFHTSLFHVGDDELLERYTCLRTGEWTEEIVNGHMGKCPLISVPPHGRLIDADALKEKQQEDADLFINAYTLMEKSRRDEALNAVANIVNAPTIIEAEG